MNPIGKKLISLFLVFSLLTINCAYFKEVEEKREGRFPGEKKHGATLIIQKKDNSQIWGELLLVRENSLLLLNAEGKDMPINIGDIKVIKISKKSRIEKGALAGLLSGVGTVVCTAGVLVLTTDVEMEEALPYILPMGAAMAVYCALIGAIIGALSKRNKKIQIEGKSDKKIKKALNYLRKIARIRDYK